MKSLERQLQEKEDELRELRKKVGGSTVSALLTQELSESRLPQVAQDRIRKRFQTASKTDGIREAIAEEVSYVNRIRSASRRSTQTTNAPQAVELVDGYRAMGLSQREAELAAGVEHSVRQMNESAEKIHEAVKGLGLSDLEADWFVNPRR